MSCSDNLNPSDDSLRRSTGLPRRARNRRHEEDAPEHRADQALCEAIDHPERSAPTVHITGTNGKTSTAAIATSLLAATGLSVGTYTSPHLQSVRERIALNGQPIGETEFGEVFEHIRPFIELVEKQLCLLYTSDAADDL